MAQNERPTIVCLCGSTRFKDQYIRENFRLTMEGHIVLSVGFFGHSDETYECSENEKAMLDALHMRKIDLADRIVVICPDGYIGDSTRREIAYAYSQGKRVDYRGDDGPLNGPISGEGVNGLYATGWFNRDNPGWRA